MGNGVPHERGGALRPQGSALFGRGYFPIAVPGKQGFLRLVAVDLFHIADIEVMVADLVVFLQAAHDGHTAVGRNPDGAALDRRKLDVEPGGLVGIAAVVVPQPSTASAIAAPGMVRIT